MTLTIKRIRMSLFWTTRFATLLRDAPPPGAPLAALGRSQSYEAIFGQLLNNKSAQPVTPAGAGAPPLSLPWPPNESQRFWIRYLNANGLHKLSGKFAFFRLVPLRRHVTPVPGLGVVLPSGLTDSATAAIERVIGEAWFHPHMATFAVHFIIRGGMSTDKMAEVCLALRRDRVLSIAGGAALFKLDEIAAKHLDALFQEAVGPANAGPLPPANPFSIVTVLRGDAESDGPVTEGGAVHRLLEAVTRWEDGKIGPLATGRISSHDVPLNNSLLFGQARSRAVWEPRHFGRDDGRSLSCYHRNLFVGTLQTEALLAFARLAEDEAAAATRPKAIRDCEDVVLKRVVALYNGEETTYRSAALQRFIDHHSLRSSVDTLSQRIWSTAKLPPLPGSQLPLPATPAA